MTPSLTRSQILFVAGFLLSAKALCCPALADQVGIDKVRLIEEQGGSYVLEADTMPRFAAAYREPVLPTRFQITSVERERLPGYVLLRYRFSTTGEPLNGNDSLLLPWGRAGASMTARWSDGSVHQNLFLRDFEGIRAPIRMLKPTALTTQEFLFQGWISGVQHAALAWSHWLLIAAIGFLTSGWRRIVLVLWFAAGHAASLVVVEALALSIPVEPVEICFVVTALLMARTAPLDNERSQAFALVMLMLGALHGVASVGGFQTSLASETELVKTGFLFCLGVDSLQLLGVCAIAAAVEVVRLALASERLSVARYAVGGLAAAMLLIAFTRGIGEISPETAATQQDAEQFELPGAQLTLGGTGARPQPPKSLTRPIAGFLTVDSYETRLEILVRLADCWSSLNMPPQETLEPEDQDSIKRQLIDAIDPQISLRIDGQPASASLTRADFVTVEPNGVFSRPTPVKESLQTAVVGLTYVYDTSAIANKVELGWELIPNDVETVPITVTDPFGGKQYEIAPDKKSVEWTNRWSGYRPPEIRAVAVETPAFPVASLLLGIVAGVIVWRIGERRAAKHSACVALLLVGATVAYPFVRWPLPMLTSAWTPSVEQSAEAMDQLLTNVYRAYDMREEGAIYDRLEQTITGPKLTEIFLATRRSLELENRGGARAKADDVEILEIRSIRAATEGGFEIDLDWTVSGSVTHFGHTHYRRNRYQAAVTIVPRGGSWKIVAIDIAQQERLL